MCLKKIMRVFEKGMIMNYYLDLHRRGLIDADTFLRKMEEQENGEQGEET